MVDKYSRRAISLLEELIKKRRGKIEESDVEQILGNIFKELIEEEARKT